MNNALTKTLTAGLMHGLKFESSLDQIEGAPPINRYWTARGIDVLFNDWCITTVENSDAYPIQTVKPYLFPMSSLTKEIEFSGERFVPIDRLNKLLKETKESDSWIEYDFSEEHVWIHPSAGIMGGWEMPLIMDFINEHHFNVFGLSPDEYIEVNETNNPYKV